MVAAPSSADLADKAFEETSLQAAAPRCCNGACESALSEIESRHLRIIPCWPEGRFPELVARPMELVSKQLALSGRLKPEARLGLAISEFAQSLNSEQRREFQSMQSAKCTQISGRDVIKVTEEINQEGARRHRSWRPHGTKVGGFLSRIQTFASIGDVLIGGSQNLIATGVWSAVRLSLTEIATNYLNYFEKLSTLFMRLGTSWALHEDFAQIFPQSEVLQTFFCEYCVVLLRLCNKIIAFGQKNTSAQLFSSIGSSFDSEFGSTQKELDQWGYLIQQQTKLLATKMAAGAEKDRFHDLKQRILRQLSPYQNDFETRWRRQRRKGTCEWIFDTQSFKDWQAMQISTSICVSGKLGSGKTVSMANIVARMDLVQSCAYVFCAAQEPISLKATNILGSIAFNLLDDLPTEAIVWKEVEKSKERINAFDPESIVDFVLDLLPKDRTYVIIADGLEDCSDDDIFDVINGLRRLMQHRLVLLCYSSRSDSRFQDIAKRRLAPRFLVSHDDYKHDEELEAYIVKEIARRNATRQLSPDLEEFVKKQLIGGAQGMYLWVSLQLDTIFPIDSKVVLTDRQILRLITHLPRNLPEAFERALENVLDCRYQGRIMKLVLSAVTPLDLYEMRVALCVVPGASVLHPEEIAKDGRQLITLCGGNLLDLDEEDEKVRFIHHSVIQHLLSPAASRRTMPYHFASDDAENFMGAICVTYLNLPILDSRLSVTKNLQSQHLLDEVVKTTRQSLPVVSRLVQHIKSRKHKQARPSQIDIGQIVTQMQTACIQEDIDTLCFAHYATSHWIFHTRFFNEENQDCRKSWNLWWRLLYGDVAAVKPPCPNLEEDSFPALLWAVKQAHGSLFRNILPKTSLRPCQVVELVQALKLHESIYDQELGDILAQYLQSLSTIAMPSTVNTIIMLLDLGANITTPHHTSGYEPMEILIHRICTDVLSRDEERKLIHAAFTHPTIQGSLGDRYVLKVLAKLRDSGKHGAVATLLTIRPNLKLEFDQLSVLR
ncbi:hypothetical protein J7T55_000986 [Diaporthe amygdali]|uniref:uncharacterized protein n=1 Tax=Phomopsis amygdali TaxID=1214568 RepID=UPI0022FDB2C0|nr:uncharacterized protein J7T55_000986 [Diaporthe amygdali]KAJ0120131.1 hypothetical protein J7T55_000986 [Diaporthe amygdali]